MTEFVFDWHKQNNNGFLSWLIVTLVTDMLKENLFDEISEKSDGFTNVSLGMTINGVEVNTENFVKRFESVLEHASKREASRMVSELAPLAPLRDFTDKLEEALRGYDSAIRRHVETLVRGQGIEVHDWER